MKRQNNFDLMRLLLAATVCLVHAYQLSGNKGLGDFSRLAVQGFFVISGFLIFRSFDVCPSYRVYAKKRLLRIYPAYGVSIIIFAIGLASLSPLDLRHYFSLEWAKFLFSNLFFLGFLKPTLPFIFADNFNSAINGALWTLKIELLFYAAVPLIFILFRYIGRLQAIIAIYAVSISYIAVMQNLYIVTGKSIYLELARQLPGQLAFFIVGAVFYFYSSIFLKRPGTLLIFGIAGLFFNNFLTLGYLEPIFVGSTVIGAVFYKYAGNFGRFGDFSYGLYIYHFPIIQILVAWRIQESSSSLFYLLALSSSVGCAVLSWHCVEKRFLRGSSVGGGSKIMKSTALNDIVHEAQISAK